MSDNFSGPLFSYQPADGEIERERERRECADKKSAAAMPLNPPPSTLAALLLECERHRVHILTAMKEGHEFYAYTGANFAALLTGHKTGYLLPPFSRLFNAAVALDLGEVPAFTSEPQTGRDAVALLDALIQWCKAKQNPASNGSGAQKLKQPPDDAIKCYRLSIVTGRKQKELAEMLSRELRRPVDQPTVSRWLRQVRAWLADGNVVPDLLADSRPKPKTVRMDPAKLERGDGRKKATRPRRSEETGRKSELQRLIAEQKGEDDYRFDPVQDED